MKSATLDVWSGPGHRPSVLVIRAEIPYVDSRLAVDIDLMVQTAGVDREINTMIAASGVSGALLHLWHHFW